MVFLMHGQKIPKIINRGDQAWYTHFRIGRTSPERYEGSQFPEGEEAQNQFFRQMTPNTGILTKQ